MKTLSHLKKTLRDNADAGRAIVLQRFFKTGSGEYGQGDVFLGITVPKLRDIAREFSHLTLGEFHELLTSQFHEERLIAVFILVLQYKRSDSAEKEKIFTFYLSHTKSINNWDIVDSSADKIVGEYLYHHSDKKTILFKLARSSNVWERRIAMIATYQFIKYGNPNPTLDIAEILISDSHDLIQKAVGWMLREVGKRCSQEILETFLRRHYTTMPRTALRYAIERFPDGKRKQYLSGTV